MDTLIVSSTVQVLLRWALQHNCAVLPKSSKPARMKTNLELWSFKLTEEEMRSLLRREDKTQGRLNWGGQGTRETGQGQMPRERVGEMGEEEERAGRLELHQHWTGRMSGRT